MHSRSIYVLIKQAYDLRFPQSAEMDQQLPDWADSNRPEAFFDIEAKSDTPVSEAQCWAMFRSLLEERFKLAMHWETKEGSVYDLVIAPGGHKMQKVTEADTERGLWFTINGHSGNSPQAPTSDLLGSTMAHLAGYISLSTPDRLGVIDKTGLEGLYKVNLAYSTDPLQYSDPDLQTALQKQLGLKLGQLYSWLSGNSTLHRKARSSQDFFFARFFARACLSLSSSFRSAAFGIVSECRKARSNFSNSSGPSHRALSSEIVSA